MDEIFAILAANPEANAIGAVAALLGGFWPLFKTRTGMLWAHAAIHVGMSLHFFLLGALSGSLMNALGLGQVLAAIPLGTRPGFKKSSHWARHTPGTAPNRCLPRAAWRCCRWRVTKRT